MEPDTDLVRIAAALRRRNRLDAPSVTRIRPEVRTPATTPALLNSALDKTKRQVRKDERAGTILVRWQFDLRGKDAQKMIDLLTAKERDLAAQNQRSSIRYQGTYGSVKDFAADLVSFVTLWDIHHKKDFLKCGLAQRPENKAKFEAAMRDFLALAGQPDRSMIASAIALRLRRRGR